MTTPKNINAAAAALAKAVENRDKIAAALAAMAGADANALPDLEAARSRVEAMLADEALGIATTGTAAAAQKALADAEQAHREAASTASRAAATRRGLDARLADAQAAVEAAQAALEGTRKGWLFAQLADLEADYLAAARTVASLHARQQSLVAALTSRGVPVPNTFSLTAPLSLPVLGPKGAEAVVQHTPAEQHGVGKVLNRALAAPSDIEAELAAHAEQKPSLIARATKAFVGGNAGPAPAGAAA
jgi:hypothetical protein